MLRTRTVIVLLAIGLAVRLASLTLAGTGDVDVWKTWSYGAARDVTGMYGVGGDPPVRGVVTWGTRKMTVDYPPGTLYALAVVGTIYRAIDPAFTDSKTLTVSIKLAILAGDVLAALGLWRLLRAWSTDAALAGVLAYWLNPAAIMDGAVLGYLDPWYGAPVMLSLACVMRRRYASAGVALAAALLMKPQAILAVPVAAALVWQQARSGRGRAVTIAAATAFAIVAVALIPYARAGALPNVRQGLASLLRHDMLSGEAANLWWIVTWLLRASYATRDLGAWAAWTMKVPILGVSRVVALGYPNPRPIAAILTLALAAWAWWRARRSGAAAVLAAGALTVHAYFCLSVQVHENHFYLALPLMAAALPLLPRLRGPYVLASAVFLLNLYLFQGFGRGFRLPWRQITIVDATVLLALVNVGALAWHARRFAAVLRAVEVEVGVVEPVLSDRRE